MAESASIYDLLCMIDPPKEPQVQVVPTAPALVGTKRPGEATVGNSNKKAAAAAPVLPVVTPAKSKPKSKPVAKKNMPHVLIWVCTHGKGKTSSTWTQKKLKVIGVYANKEAAEAKKLQVMSQYSQCGYGDIMVGDCWDDEIDLVIRPAEECDL